MSVKPVLAMFTHLAQMFGLWKEMVFDNQLSFKSQELQNFADNLGTSSTNTKNKSRSSPTNTSTQNDSSADSLAKTRMIPYKTIENKKLSPLQLLLGDYDRMLEYRLESKVDNVKEDKVMKLDRFCFYRQRPDLNNDWSEGKAIRQIGNSIIEIEEANGNLIRQTKKNVKLLFL
uniref:Integrase catalytic domain-containing protein n=1 Tax=Strongyloides venezuelensis TaxID=75913 RepID=A0A0K0FRL9_STRVS